MENKEGLIKLLKKKVHCTQLYNTVYRNDRGLWELFLENRYGKGKTSCNLLRLNELFDLYDFMQVQSASGGASAKQIRFIRMLWKQRSSQKTESALIKFVNRVTGKSYEKLIGMAKEDATKVILAAQKL